MLRGPWTPGPEAGFTDSVLVAVTAFHSDTWRDLPGIHRSGRALGRAWPRLDGAVGMWLWTEPLRRRCGSVSIWRSEQDLRRFVTWPEHVTIMRRYGGRGRLMSASWQADRCRPAAIWAEARSRLRGGMAP